MSPLSQSIIAIALLVINAFFVAAEFALLAARRSRMEQLAAEGDRRAAAALDGLKELSVTLAGAQLGITMASLGLGIVGEPLVAGFFEHLLVHQTPLPESLAVPLGFGIGLTIVVFLHMVVGEMAPKSWAIADPESSALVLARPFHWFVMLFRPVIVALNAMANGVVRLAGVAPTAGLSAAHSPADLLMVIRASAEEGTIRGEEQRLLARALELSGLDAESVMIPRPQVVAVSHTATPREILTTARESGRSRLPVYRDDLDNVVGILTVKDLLLATHRDELELDLPASKTVRSLSRQALIVPESRGIEDLLIDMREQRQHIALVVDEYGSVNGLVSLEDIVEELIGDFDDETDRVHRRGKSASGELVLPGSLRPREFTNRTGVELPDGPYETVSGYIEHTAQELPDVGTVVRDDDFTLRVVSLDGYSVGDVVVTVHSSDSAENE